MKFKVNDVQNVVMLFAWTFAINQPHCFGVRYIIIIIKLTIWLPSDWIQSFFFTKIWQNKILQKRFHIVAGVHISIVGYLDFNV